jgi:hypothetical protein
VTTVNGNQPTIDVNAPDVVAEVAAVFEEYERSLVDNDVDALGDAFWASELVVRYGVNECLYGAEEITAWRRSAAPLPPGRRTGPTTIATFGRDVACVNTEFRYPGGDKIGRQSQTWLRLAEGWRIVSAHVSLMPAQS